LKYVVTYDVMSDKMRQKVADCLEDFGDRVQLSVFEVDVDFSHYQKMVSRLEKLIDREHDGVRIYPLCSKCLGKVHIIGQGEVIRDPEVIVI